LELVVLIQRLSLGDLDYSRFLMMVFKILAKA